MVVIVTNDVPERFRGFLASVALEIAPGVYATPSMNAGIRERVWAILEEWHLALGRGSIVMTWRDPNKPGGQELRTLGLPQREFVELEGLFTTRSEPTADKQALMERLGRLGVHHPGGSNNALDD
ncbi:MAG: type I-E CRISPR-associated endoribonuclease Cas2e [Immundisolibacter sp.]